MAKSISSVRAAQTPEVAAEVDPVRALAELLPLDFYIAVMRTTAEEMLATDGDDLALPLSSADLRALDADARRSAKTNGELRVLRRFMKGLARGATQPLRALGKPAAGLIRDQATELRSMVVSGWVETLWGALEEDEGHELVLTPHLLPFAAPEVFRQLTAGLNKRNNCVIATWEAYATLGAGQCAPTEACRWCLRLFTDLLRKRVDAEIAGTGRAVIALADDASLVFKRTDDGTAPYSVTLSQRPSA